MPLVHDLQPLVAEDYAEAIRQYVETCSTLPGVLAIYQFGSIRAPGLSDIDMAIVLDESASSDPSQLARLSIKHESWRDNQLIARCFVHDVYLCPSTVFSQIDWLVPDTEWVSRFGAPSPREQPSPEERDLIPLIHGLDFCIGRIQELAHLHDGPHGSMRWLILQLWSLTHTSRILLRYGCTLEETWTRVLTRLQELRAMRVATIRDAHLAELLPDVLEHFLRAVDHYATLLQARALRDHPGPAHECAVALYANRVVHRYAASGGNEVTRLLPAAISRRMRLAGRTVDSTWSILSLPGTVLTQHLAYLARDKRHRTLAARIARRAGLTTGINNDPYHRAIARRQALAQRSERRIRVGDVTLSGFRIPGLPAPVAGSMRAGGSWRYRAVRSWLDWTLLPRGAVGVGR